MALFETLTGLVSLKAASAVAGLTIAGGAVAGATDNLPDPLQNAFDTVSGAVQDDEQDLEIQDADAEDSSAVQDAKDATEPGPDRGKAVSEAASQGRAGGNGEGEANRSQTATDVHEAIDATEPGPERGAAVSEAASGGKAGSDEGTDGTTDGDTDGTTDGDTDGDTDGEPQGSAETGSEAAEAGAANADQHRPGDDS